MYTSKYYTCEQIDERLLQGYYDDAVANGFTGNKAEFWEKILSIPPDLANLIKANHDSLQQLINQYFEKCSTDIYKLTGRVNPLEISYGNILSELSEIQSELQDIQPLTEGEIDALVNGILV